MKIYAVLIAGLCLFSCTKSQQDFYPENHIVDIRIRGFISQDSLQFKFGERVIKPIDGEPGLYFSGNVSSDQVSNGPTTVSIFNGKGERLAEKKIDGTATDNFVKFYYDGTSLIDKLPAIPAPTPGNACILLNFPDRKYSKVAAENIQVELSLAKRGQPTIKKTFPFKADGTAFIDLNVPSIYQSMSLRLLKAGSTSDGYAGNDKTFNILMNAPKTGQGFLILVQEFTDQDGTFLGAQGVELTQYFK